MCAIKNACGPSHSQNPNSTPELIANQQQNVIFIYYPIIKLSLVVPTSESWYIPISESFNLLLQCLQSNKGGTYIWKLQLIIAMLSIQSPLLNHNISHLGNELLHLQYVCSCDCQFPHVSMTINYPHYLYIEDYPKGLAHFPVQSRP